jgi:hypothetical protein
MTTPRVYPVTATGRPDGADLTVAAHHYEHFLKDVFDVVDRDDKLRELLADLLFGDPPNHDPHMPDRPSRDDVLAEALVAALPAASRTIRLHRGPLTALADSLDYLLGRRSWLPWQGRRVA